MALWDPRAAGAPAEGRWGFYDSVNKPGGQREARWDTLESVFFSLTHTQTSEGQTTPPSLLPVFTQRCVTAVRAA